MNEQLHILITRDRGKITRFATTRKKLHVFFSTSIIILFFLIGTSIFAISLFIKNQTISSNLQQQLKINKEVVAQFKKYEEDQKLKLNLQVANLKLNNMKQAAAFKEKNLMMSTAVSELNERNELIEKIMDTIGIDLKKKREGETKNSGGPFIAQPDRDWDEILFKTDSYLKTINCIPLGKPVQGRITSRFGKRRDPVNKKKAFHTGIDFHGKRGEKIYATADGVVKKRFKNGGYGKYLLIDHGNGYTTSFAHLQSFLVKKGDRIKRGQPIGLVGSTGRSTGPHLHYEVCLNKKPINPYKYMTIAKLLEK